MQNPDNERAVSPATSEQHFVARSLHVRKNAQNSAAIAWKLYQLQGYGAEIDYLNKVVSVPKTKFNSCIAKISLSVRQHGWHTQIGVL